MKLTRRNFIKVATGAVAAAMLPQVKKARAIPKVPEPHIGHAEHKRVEYANSMCSPSRQKVHGAVIYSGNHPKTHWPGIKKWQDSIRMEIYPNFLRIKQED